MSGEYVGKHRAPDTITKTPEAETIDGEVIEVRQATAPVPALGVVLATLIAIPGTIKYLWHLIRSQPCDCAGCNLYPRTVTA